MAVQESLFSTSTILSLHGAVLMTTAVSAAFQRAFDRNPKWLALGTAVVVALAGSVLSGGGWLNYFLAPFNACFIYCYAVGVPFIVNRSTPSESPEAPLKALRLGRRGYFTPWY